MTKRQFLEKSRLIHGYKYTYNNLPEKITLKEYIDVVYNDVTYIQRVSKHFLGKCPEKTTLTKTTEQFINESKLVWGDRFDYTLTKYVGSNKLIKIIDKLSGFIIEQKAIVHLNGHESKIIDNDKFIELSKNVSDSKYIYDKCTYINKTTNVILNCVQHGYFEINPFNHLNYGNGCKRCVEYKFKKQIIKFLNGHNLNFNCEYKFKKNNLSFDFYIPTFCLCIDCVYKFGDNDKIKTDYCEDNYIDLIRIRYDQIDNIYNILYVNLKDRIKRSKASLL